MCRVLSLYSTTSPTLSPLVLALEASSANRLAAGMLARSSLRRPVASEALGAVPTVPGSPWHSCIGLPGTIDGYRDQDERLILEEQSLSLSSDSG
jgi:hypothetical protein